MGYHDLEPEAFFSVEVRQTNSAEDAYLFRKWIDEQGEKAKRLMHEGSDTRGGATYCGDIGMKSL